MPRDVQSARLVSPGYVQPSNEAAGELECVSVRKADNGGYIVTCMYERGQPEDYVYESGDDADAYLLKQRKRLGKE